MFLFLHKNLIKHKWWTAQVAIFACMQTLKTISRHQDRVLGGKFFKTPFIQITVAIEIPYQIKKVRPEIDDIHCGYFQYKFSCGIVNM